MLPTVSKEYFHAQARPLLDKLEAEFGVRIDYVVHNDHEGLCLDLDIVFPLTHYCYDELDGVGDEIYVRFCAWLSDFEALIGAQPSGPWWDRERRWLGVSPDRLL